MSTRLRYIPTKKIKEILNNNHTVTDTGTDYEPVKHDLESILREREERTTNNDLIANYWEEYEQFLDSEGVPPLPMGA